MFAGGGSRERHQLPSPCLSRRAQGPRSPQRPASERPRENAAPAVGQVAPRSENQEFEDKLKKFMQESEGRIADNRLYADRPRRGRKH